MTTTATLQGILERAVPRVDQGAWLRWGTVTFFTVEAVHQIAGVLVNSWGGWGEFLENLTFVVVSGLVMTGLTYGLLVRWALKPSSRARNRAAAASLFTGVLSAFAYAAIFLWAHLLIAPAAVLLSRAGFLHASSNNGRGKTMALTGGVLGLAVLAFGVFLIIAALLNGGEYPFIGN